MKCFIEQKNPVINLTVQEFDSLDHDAKNQFWEYSQSRARPYNSNYHLCEVLAAVSMGFIIDDVVINSYDDFTKHIISNRILSTY